MKKKSIIISIILFLSVINVHATTNTRDRNTLDNYGVNKDWELDSNNMDNVLRTKSVLANEKIYDFADILTEEEENKLFDRIMNFTENTKMDMVILTDNYEYPERLKNSCYNDDVADKEIFDINDEYAADFYDYNDFGMNFDNNSGILIFRNTAIDPCFNAMYYDMYTFGDGQLYFDKNRYDDILDSIYDDLHNENYLEGFLDFIEKTEDYIESGRPSALENYFVTEKGYLQTLPRTYQIPWLICSGISFIITLITILVLVNKNKMVRAATDANIYLKNNGETKITNRQDIFVTSHVTSYTESDSSSGGGFSSSSGSSGGGHSSGGGRHG